jgi:DNA-binding HxlR family transcriptional regulator
LTGALQLVGDKWTLLVVRDLWQGPLRTRELLTALAPISSRTLLGRLRDMERDALVIRKVLGKGKAHVEYELTPRGRLLFPLLDALWKIGRELGCNECADRLERRGSYCDVCPYNDNDSDNKNEAQTRPPAPHREQDDSIVLL